MAVLEMQKIHICAWKSNRRKILEELQKRGVVQIEDGGSEDEVFRKTDTASVRAESERLSQNAADALRVLERYAPEKKGLLSSLEGKRELTQGQYQEGEERCEKTNEVIRRILSLEKGIAEENAARTRAQTSMETLRPWLGLDVPMNYTGTRSAAAFVGAMPGQWSEESILEAVAREAPELSAFSVEVLGRDRDQTCLFAVCARNEAGRLEDVLRQCGFVRPQVQTDQVPAEYAAALEEEAAEHERAAQAAAKELENLAGERENIQFAADYYSMQAEKYRVLGEMLQSEHTFLVEGYTPGQSAQALKESLEQKFICQVELSAVPEDEEAPVLLHNNAFSAPTEGVVEAFGLPAKGEVDPTGIMAFFYYFLFGLMLGDAAYGLIMVIGCAFALKKYPNMGSGIKKMLQMFLYCGISTTFWGVMFGSYFGDAVTVISQTFFHRTVTIPALWFEPLDDPMKLLMFSFLFGIIHLFTGLGVKGYMLLKARQVMDFICSVVLWYMLLIGLILMLLPSEMFASMAGTAFVFPGWLHTLAKWMAIIGAVGIVLMSARDKKNVAVRLALGAYDLYGASSWLSDVLSYSRLLALGLATGVIASVINTMASMLGDGIISAIGFALIFIVGHTLNIAINLLGAYVHTNRLQFVEFFGKFYEGGGKGFHPFSADNNKYFKFKEEN